MGEELNSGSPVERSARLDFPGHDFLNVRHRHDQWRCFGLFSFFRKRFFFYHYSWAFSQNQGSRTKITVIFIQSTMGFFFLFACIVDSEF